MHRKKALFIASLIFFSLPVLAQVPTDTLKPVLPVHPVDSTLRIKNINPYFQLHVDSSLRYQFDINRDEANYYWYLKNAPVGLKIDKDHGTLTFKAERSYFLSGRLKYDYEYRVEMGLQNLNDPTERVDTAFKILFYNTEIVPSRLKPSVTNNIFIEEGDTINFTLQCENGSFPIEEITYFSNYQVKSSTPVTKCNDEFTWYAPFDFVKDTDKDRQRIIDLIFVGKTKFSSRDTASIKIFVRKNINYPQRVAEFTKLRNDVSDYVVQLKGSFRVVDKRLKKTKKARTGFDLASAATGLGGTVFSSMPNEDQRTAGKILPSVGVAMVPVKEASSPNSSSDQTMATLIRNSIKRLEYLLSENTLIGARDPDIVIKTNKLKDELKQAQIQLIDVPMPEENLTNKELDEYFNNPKVNKKYKIKNRT